MGPGDTHTRVSNFLVTTLQSHCSASTPVVLGQLTGRDPTHQQWNENSHRPMNLCDSLQETTVSHVDPSVSADRLSSLYVVRVTLYSSILEDQTVPKRTAWFAGNLHVARGYDIGSDVWECN